jgi:hypothetical protein
MWVHECTSDFDYSTLERVFGDGRFAVESIVFSPTDLGIPSSRPRRCKGMNNGHMSRSI